MDSTVKKDEKAAAEVVVTKRAFNLACSWVQKMSGGADLDVEEESKSLPADDGADVRPMRLGLGAKYLSHSQANRVSSQVDKKLRAKLMPMTARPGTAYQGGRRENKMVEEEAAVQAQDEDDDDDDDSRALKFKKRSNAFVRPALIVSDTPGSKKKKKKGS